MEALKGLFDVYGRQADSSLRLFALSPAILAAVALVPSIYTLATALAALHSNFDRKARYCLMFGREGFCRRTPIGAELNQVKRGELKTLLTGGKHAFS
jgi:hypothetical protein